MLRLVIHLLYGVEGQFVQKTEVEDYIKHVKNNNPNGVVLCIETEKGTHEKIKTQGAFNVYLQVGDTVYIDFLGKGFDMGAITKGKSTHESWTIPWDEILFLEPNNMNRFGYKKIDEENYIQTVNDRKIHLINLNYSLDEIEKYIPKKYSPIPIWVKDMLINEIIIPLYYKQQRLILSGLKSFGIQGMIVEERLFPIEMNRKDRFAEKKFTDMER